MRRRTVFGKLKQKGCLPACAAWGEQAQIGIEYKILKDPHLLIWTL